MVVAIIFSTTVLKIFYLVSGHWTVDMINIDRELIPSVEKVIAIWSKFSSTALVIDAFYVKYWSVLISTRKSIFLDPLFVQFYATKNRVICHLYTPLARREICIASFKYSISRISRLSGFGFLLLIRNDIFPFINYSTLDQDGQTSNFNWFRQISWLDNYQNK